MSKKYKNQSTNNIIRGFTLIELLAVIVILAIIALIAVPIVLGIINDSKKSSEKESVKLYLDTVEKAITKKQMNNPNFNPDKCEIKDKGNLECFKGTTSLGIVEIEMKGQVPSRGEISIIDNKFVYKNIKFNGQIYYKYSFITLELDTDHDGKVSVGDKYSYKVNNNDTFNFYVLSFNEDDTVNLIMDRNICEDGTQVDSTLDECGYRWDSPSDLEENYINGPTTAMEVLYNATKNWINVPNMVMNYYDENTVDDTRYIGIMTDNGVTTIIGKNNVIKTIGTPNEPLKARLIMYSEADVYDYGELPFWLIENMEPAWAYWCLSSYSSDPSAAETLNNDGYLVDEYRDEKLGIRPVITVSKSDLQ